MDFIICRRKIYCVKFNKNNPATNAIQVFIENVQNINTYEQA